MTIEPRNLQDELLFKQHALSYDPFSLMPASLPPRPRVLCTPADITRVREWAGADVVASVIDGQVTANVYLPGDMDPWAIQPLDEFEGHGGAQATQHVIARASAAIRPPMVCGTDERMCAPGCGEEGGVLRGPATADTMDSSLAGRATQP